MTVMDDLNQLRADCPGCQTVVYADLSTLMVLCASSEERLPQERYDQLCRDGAEIFDCGALTAASDVLTQQLAVGTEAVRYAGKGLQAFLRGAANPAEVMCLDCKPGVDPDAVLRAARSVLEKLGEAHG